MKKKGDWPAFPGEQGHIPEGTWNQTWEPGMSYRDWLIGMALQGLVSKADVAVDDPQKLAQGSLALADAVLAELAKEGI